MTTIKYTTILINVTGTAALDGTTLFDGTPETGVVDPVTGVISYDVVGPIGVFDLAAIIGIRNLPLAMQGLTIENDADPHANESVVEIESPPTLDNPAARARALAIQLGGKSGLFPDTNYVVPVDHRLAINTVADGATPGPHTIQFSIAEVTDDLLNGLLAVKANSVNPPTQWLLPVRVTSAANVDLATLNAGDTIDDVVVVLGDRVLLRNQTDPIENGVYVIQADPPGVRSADMATDAEVRSGLTIIVTEGTAFTTTQWTLDTANPIVLGTTALSFAQTGGVVTGQRVWLNHKWLGDDRADKAYIPMDGVTVLASAFVNTDEVRAFFPVKMRLVKIVAWSNGTVVPGVTDANLHINDNTTPQKIVTVDMDANDAEFIFDFADAGTDDETTQGEFTAISFTILVDPLGELRAISYWEPITP